MSSIYTNKEKIMESNPKYQEIKVSLHSKKWEKLYDSYPLVKKVFEQLAIKNGKIIITRDDVFKTNGKARIIKALVWAFADKPYKNHIISVLTNLDSIYALLRKNEGKTLSKTDFIQLYKTIDAIPGVNRSTYSILLYFYKVICEEDMAVAVTGHITPVFKDFDELKGFENRIYYKQMHQINEIARNIGVQADWVEYYLYLVYETKKSKGNHETN